MSDLGHDQSFCSRYDEGWMFDLLEVVVGPSCGRPIVPSLKLGGRNLSSNLGGRAPPGEDDAPSGTLSAAGAASDGLKRDREQRCSGGHRARRRPLWSWVSDAMPHQRADGCPLGSSWRTSSGACSVRSCRPCPPMRRAEQHPPS